MTIAIIVLAVVAIVALVTIGIMVAQIVLMLKFLSNSEEQSH
jgi:hypothetical protein